MLTIYLLVQYDHGTWCAGASLGNCINSSSSATAYNGIASKAKISIFDVDFSATENYLNVPSLYEVALPIAYNVGARVHSNSWTTYYMSSYTSKSIDVDEFTYDNPDFLFIAGAGNSGDTGYNSVTSPANSKNAIAVGASSVNHNNIVYFSSLGSSYDSAFKPNIVTPGRYLQSAGVRMINETTSCNVEISSGTSMATPIAAGAAILIRHYLENSSYWGTFCNTQYKSCPNIVPFTASTNFISSSLLRAVIIHSGEPMNLYESTSSNMIPETNLTSPPNNFEGWGQLRLSSVLPIPNLYDFDLYVSDSVSMESLTRHTYFTTVTSSLRSFRVTIAWTDPPNINWGTKNLLNDLDLIVITPDGMKLYGNSIFGDEYNTQEKVVVDNPMLGEYQIFVQSKIFVGQYPQQQYSIVITSIGSVSEDKFQVTTITQDDINESDSCESDDADNMKAISFQLEDWYAGESFQNNSISLLVTDTKTSTLYAECQFLSNEVQSKAEFTRTSQCVLCLHKKTSYTTQLSVGQSTSPIQNIPSVIRTVSPECNIYLSSFAQTGSLDLNGKGECNSCSSNGFLTVTMYANVTDDDESQYSWSGSSHNLFSPSHFFLSHNLLPFSLLDIHSSCCSLCFEGMGSHHILFNIKIKHFLPRELLPSLMNNLIGMELLCYSLLLPSHPLIRYCVNKKGTYILSFNDTLLYSNYRKHGKVVMTLPDGSTVTFDETSSTTVKITLPDSLSDDDEDDDHGLTQGQMVGISVGGAVLGLVIIGGLLYM